MNSPCDTCKKKICLETGKPCEKLEKYLPKDDPQKARNIYAGKVHEIKQLRGK